MIIKPFSSLQISNNKDVDGSPSSLIYNNQKHPPLNKVQPAFYVCRTTNQKHICSGIIAQLSYHSSHNKIYKHEECFNEKITNFCFTFQKLNIQLSPTLLVHDDHLEIEQYLHSITNNSTPDIVYNYEKTTYEIWVVIPSKEIEDLYSSIKYLFIADGHHRISCLFSLSKDVCAYIIPKKFLKSYPIIRKYNHFHKSPATFFEKAKYTFDSRPLSNEKLNLWQGQYFALIYGKNSIVLSNTNNQKDFLKILSSFSSINYIIERKPNFSNYKFDLNCEKLNYCDSREDKTFHLFIPAINIDSYFGYSRKLLPVHSSWFEPKLPPGIIQMKII